MQPAASKETIEGGPVAEWVRPVREPVVWICQAPRSGGTLLLRLLDSHPQLHGYPSVFGFTNPKMIWPSAEELSVGGSKLLTEVFAKMSLAKFDRTGMSKQSSNMAQDVYPIYFDQDWFEAIFAAFNTAPDGRRAFESLFTAVFNAWRNYQSLYFEKKYIIGHMTMRWGQLEHYVENFRRFQRTYPDGYMVFMTREPDDWMASFTSLKKATPYTGDPRDAAEFYKAYYRQALQVHDSGRLIVLRFRDLVVHSEETMRCLADRLGLEWNPLLLQPTFNGAPWFQNSSFERPRLAAIDSGIVGKGKDLSPEIASAVDAGMWDLHDTLSEHALAPR